jgi:hypothetical protein
VIDDDRGQMDAGPTRTVPFLVVGAAIAYIGHVQLVADTPGVEPAVSPEWAVLISGGAIAGVFVVSRYLLRRLPL